MSDAELKKFIKKFSCESGNVREENNWYVQKIPNSKSSSYCEEFCILDPFTKKVKVQ